MKGFGVSVITQNSRRRQLSAYSSFVILLGFFLIGGLWSFVCYQISQDYDRTIAETSQETMNLTKAFEENVRKVASDIDKDLLNLKEAYEQGGISSPVFAAYAKTASRDPDRSLVLVMNEQGVGVVSFILNAIEGNYSDREYFQFHRDSTNDMLYIGKPILGRVGGQTIIPMSRRINKPDGSFGGIVYIGLKTDYFLSFYQKVNLGQNQLLSLTGLDGFVRARQSGDTLGISQDVRAGEVWRRIQDGRSYDTYLASSVVDGISRVFSYRLMPDYPLIILVAKSTQVALGSFVERKQGYTLWAVLASGFIVIFCALLLNQHRNVREQQSKLIEVNDKLVETSEQYRALTENSPDIISRLDKEGRRLYMNEATAKLVPGLSRADMIGKTSEELGMPPEHCTLLGNAINEVFLGANPVHQTVNFTCNGKTRYYAWRLVPEFDNSGRVNSALSVATDISHLIDTEQRLEQSEKLYRNLVDTASVIILTANSRREITFVNDYGLSFLGYRAEELIGRTSFETIIPEYESTGRNLHKALIGCNAKGAVLPHSVNENITRSGQRIWVDWSNRTFINPKTGAVNLLCVGIDITERRAMEEELKRHRDNLQLLVEEQVREIFRINTELTAIFASISDPFFVFDTEWRLTYINKEAALSRVNETHIGEIIWEIFPELIGSEIHQKCYEACNSSLPVQMIFKGLISEKVFDVRLYPYVNGLIAYGRDVTEQKKYEAELSRLDRLNLVGEMAAGIGHEIRNPLTTVRGYLQLFLQKEKYAEHRGQFTTMIEELDRANAIISEYLSLAKNKAVEFKVGNINSILDALFPLLQAEAFQSGHDLQMATGDIPDIWLAGCELRQLVLNLVRNGFDAMQPGRTLTIKSYVESDEVVLAVRDTGKGIPLAMLDKLGTPFATTKETGTGLGLAVCFRVAERHGAKIDVETSSEGTTFYVKFKQSVPQIS